jgi:hypothetical protein
MDADRLLAQLGESGQDDETKEHLYGDMSMSTIAMAMYKRRMLRHNQWNGEISETLGDKAIAQHGEYWDGVAFFPDNTLIYRELRATMARLGPVGRNCKMSAVAPVLGYHPMLEDHSLVVYRTGSSVMRSPFAQITDLADIINHDCAAYSWPEYV